MIVPVILIHADDRIRTSVGQQLEQSGEIAVVASVRHAETGISALAATPDAVVVMEQPEIDATGRAPFIDTLQKVSTKTRLVVLIESIEPKAVIAALRCGATSILRSDFSALAGAVRLTADNVGVIDPEALGVFVNTLVDLPRNPLSTRERDVLSCLAAGLSNAEAAAKLFVSRETIKSHVAHVLRKLEVEDRFAAVDKATRIGLLS